jgi:hypothetical protein
MYIFVKVRYICFSVISQRRWQPWPQDGGERSDSRSDRIYSREKFTCHRVHPCAWAPRHEDVLGKWRYSSTHSLTSALDGDEWSASRRGSFTPRERALGTHWIGGWVGPRAVLDAVVKREIPSPRRESNPRTPTVQPVAQRYTDWAITALMECTGQWIVPQQSWTW